MKTEFVPYELALRMKQLGFDEKCFCNWEESWSPEPEDEIRMVLTTDQTWLRPGWVSAPTFSQAFRFFRDKYNIRVWVEWGSEYLCLAMIQYDSGMKKCIDYCSTDEEAELACLEKLIEIVENKK
jgi:hypothetical protein